MAPFRAIPPPSNLRHCIPCPRLFYAIKVAITMSSNFAASDSEAIDGLIVSLIHASNDREINSCGVALEGKQKRYSQAGVKGLVSKEIYSTVDIFFPSYVSIMQRLWLVELRASHHPSLRQLQGVLERPLPPRQELEVMALYLHRLSQQLHPLPPAEVLSARESMFLQVVAK